MKVLKKHVPFLRYEWQPSLTCRDRSSTHRPLTSFEKKNQGNSDELKKYIYKKYE